MNAQNSALPVKQFAIYGLYGDRDIIIPIDYKCKILISENGVGKTILLNALYAVLTSRFSGLEALEFEKIVITFPDHEITLYKNQIPKRYKEDEPIIREIKEKLPEKLDTLIKLSQRLTPEKLKNHLFLKYSASELEMAPGLLAVTSQ